MGKRRFYPQRQNIYPVNACPFEAIYNGLWCNVDYLRIKDGKIITHFENHGFVTEEKLPVESLRIKSRKANLSDCTCFLRPGLDVCVLSTSPIEADSHQESRQPAWIDGKINSIERKPHDHRCTCRFYISLNEVHHPLHREKNMVNGEIQELCMDRIAILQQLGSKPCEDGYFRWVSLKDCHSKVQNKLFRGQFMYDVLWFLVASSVKGVEFVITSVQDKMLYGILDGDTDIFSFHSGKIVKAVNFRVEGGVFRPIISDFVPQVPVETSAADETIKTVPPLNSEEDGLGSTPPYDLMHLRRSERRKRLPQRYLGDGGFAKVKSCISRATVGRKRTWENAVYIISKKSENDCSTHPQCSEDTSTKDTGTEVLETLSGKESTQVQGAANNGRTSTVRKKQKSSKAGTSCKRPVDDEVLCGQVQKFNSVVKRKNKRLKILPRTCTTSKPQTLSDDPVPTNCDDDTVLNQPENVVNHDEKVRGISSKCVKSNSEQNKSMSRGNKMIVDKHIKKTSAAFRSKRLFYSRMRFHFVVGRRSRTKNAYKEIIEECMKNIDSEIAKHQKPAVYQWEEIISHQRWKLPRPPPSTGTVESPELEDLWKEMEIAMLSTDAEGTQSKSSGDDGQLCQHDYVLNEQIGTICQLCGSVGTEIRYILPPFWEKQSRMRNLECEQLKFERKGADYLKMNTLHKWATSRNISIPDKSESVWTLIPDFLRKLHDHQKKAFEFLWKNIAGSLMPANMDASIERIGGCIISHSPGTGKTLLIISFLESYLKLFPRKRPLILAPKTTLHTWIREFKKWEVSVPVYQIHARGSYRKELHKKKVRASPNDFCQSRDVMHTLDCVEKLKKWHEHASILLMSYPSFLSIMRGKSVLKHWVCAERILRQSPGLLILDEGHNPRSTNSILRKNLMEVKTEQRILLSGTLFQNSFEEYFNTLCLARPGFISKVLKKLDPNPRGTRYIKGCPSNYKEKRARKFFLEKIAKRINSKEDEERKKGLNKLKKITSGFIDVYEGGSSDRLPGLKSYRLLIKPTVIQQRFLAMLQNNNPRSRYQLELELLVRFVSIHPWLIKTIPQSDQYYSQDELKELEKCKLDVKTGSKVRFVVNLVRQCTIKREKVLIFCHNISPIKFFVEIFESIFGWTKGDEVLVLYGEQELFERSRVIDKFEEPGGSSQVLIASICACSEGISLTAASRVVLLDSEWNPSKTKQAVGRAFRPGQEKFVYVYHLLASGTVEEDKHGRNKWKERISRMISVGTGTEDTYCRQAENIDDEVLKKILEEDHGQLIHMITKDEKLPTSLGL